MIKNLREFKTIVLDFFSKKDIINLQKIKKMKYYSQTKQDIYLDTKIFQKKKNGFFLDIGAHDGITYSNTYFFEKHREWKGICIEPLPNVFKKLKVNRNCILVNGALAEDNKIVNFLQIEGYSEMLSGITKNYNKDHLKRIDLELKEHGGSKKEIQIKSYNINTLLSENNIKTIDYCSIDVEGSELEIIKTFNFSEIDIKVFSIENNYKDDKVRDILQENNYVLFDTVGSDDIFIQKNYLNTNGLKFTEENNSRIKIIYYYIIRILKNFIIKTTRIIKQ
jgi:FkbM family methyltransferase